VELKGGIGTSDGRISARTCLIAVTLKSLRQFEVNGDGFEPCRSRAVPAWNLGATANAAFRAAIFEDPEIGLMDEALGVGTPTGFSLVGSFDTPSAVETEAPSTIMKE
jgi:hypothetical protein